MKELSLCYIAYFDFSCLSGLYVYALFVYLILNIFVDFSLFVNYFTPMNSLSLLKLIIKHRDPQTVWV